MKTLEAELKEHLGKFDEEVRSHYPDDPRGWEKHGDNYEYYDENYTDWLEAMETIVRKHLESVRVFCPNCGIERPEGTSDPAAFHMCVGRKSYPFQK